MKPIDPESIEGSALTFYFAKGKTLEERYRPLHEHILMRKANQVWQYSEVFTSRMTTFRADMCSAIPRQSPAPWSWSNSGFPAWMRSMSPARKPVGRMFC